MAKVRVKNNRSVPLEIPANKGPESIESQFLALYDRVDGKSVFLRECLYVGFTLRKLGVSQAFMDLMRSDAWGLFDNQQKKELLAKLIIGSGIDIANLATPPLSTLPSTEPISAEPEQSDENKSAAKPKVKANGLAAFGI